MSSKQNKQYKEKNGIMAAELYKISEIKSNPNNPRVIKDDKFKKLVQSLKDFPAMAVVRPIVVNTDMIVLGGNMRLKAMKEAGWKEVPVTVVDWSEEKQKEFIIKDNVGFGEWDFEMLANDWDSEKLEDWGLDLPGFDDAEDVSEENDDKETEAIQKLEDRFIVPPFLSLTSPHTITANRLSLRHLIALEKASFNIFKKSLYSF